MCANSKCYCIAFIYVYVVLFFERFGKALQLIDKLPGKVFFFFVGRVVFVFNGDKFDFSCKISSERVQ